LATATLLFDNLKRKLQSTVRRVTDAISRRMPTGRNVTINITWIQNKFTAFVVCCRWQIATATTCAWVEQSAGLHTLSGSICRTCRRSSTDHV